MKRFLAGLLVLMLIFMTPALAVELDDLFGGLTSMFSPDVEEAYKPGEVAEMEHINIKLKNVLQSGKNEFYTPQDGNEFLIVEFEIENTSDEAMSFSTMMNFSTWCDGEMCTLSLEALGMALLAGKMQLDCIVESDERVTGVIGYEVPVDWKEIVVEYKEEPFGGDTASFIVNKD